MTTTYKCPSCGAAMEFDSESQKMKCPQCGNQVDVSSFGEMHGDEQGEAWDNGGAEGERGQTYDENSEFAGQDFGSEQFEGDGFDGTMNMKVYHCQSCGAELMSDEYTSAVICSFCGNPSLVEDRLTGAYKPKKIIPFKINREQAKDIYRKWVRRGKLTPSTLKSQSTIEKISGLYVPFWLYDYRAESQMVASAEKIRTRRSGDTEYTYHDHFHVYRDVEADFQRIPADASEKMEDGAMDKMEPYLYNELEPFAPAYLQGYLSERYNLTHQEMEPRVNRRVDKYITEMTRDTIVGYSTVSVRSNRIRRSNYNVQYVLLPVWVLNCRYQNKDFQFMLNGQTGKIVADRPISKLRALAWGAGIFAATLIITMLGGLLIL